MSIFKAKRDVNKCREGVVEERLGQLIYEQSVCVHAKTLKISDSMFAIKHKIDHYKLLRRSYVVPMISVELIIKV